jgi:hypothetical protein
MYVILSVLLHYSLSYYPDGLEYTRFRGTDVEKQSCQLFTVNNMHDLMCAMKCNYISSCVGFTANQNCTLCIYSPKCKTTNFSRFDHFYFKSQKPAPGFLLADIDKELMDGFLEYEPCTECPLQGGNYCKEEIINITEFIHVSAGPLGVWAIDELNHVYYQRYDSSWMLIPEDVIKMKQLDVGRNIWAVDTESYIYIRDGISSNYPTGSSWKRIDNHLIHVTSTLNYNVWGISPMYDVFYRTNASSLNPTGSHWIKAVGWLSQISAKSAGVWALNNKFEVFYQQNTYGDPVDSTLYVVNKYIFFPDIKLIYVSVGDGIVWGLNPNGDMIYRKGITSNVPIGTGWVYYLYNSGARKIEVYKNHIWLVK